MRTIAEIRADIIEASKNYRVVLNMAYTIMPDAETFVPGAHEVLADMEAQVIALYKEMFDAYGTVKGKAK